VDRSPPFFEEISMEQSRTRGPRPAAKVNVADLVAEMLARSVSETAYPLGGLAGSLREAAEDDPLAALAATVAAASTVFYLAERGKNPKVRSPHDALVLITTSLSVGCTDIFPRTKIGKLVTSFVMSVGPGLSSRAFEPEARATKSEGALRALVSSQQELGAKLERLVRALEAAPRGNDGARSHGP